MMYSFALQNANLTLAHMATLKSSRISATATGPSPQSLGTKPVNPQRGTGQWESIERDPNKWCRRNAPVDTLLHQHVLESSLPQGKFLSSDFACYYLFFAF